MLRRALCHMRSMGSWCWIYWNLLQTDKSFIIFSVSLPKYPLRWTFVRVGQTLHLSYNHCNEEMTLQLKYAHEDSSWILFNCKKLPLESPDELLLWDAAVAVNVEGFKQLPVAQIIIIKWCNYRTNILHDNYTKWQDCCILSISPCSDQWVKLGTVALRVTGLSVVM